LAGSPPDKDVVDEVQGKTKVDHVSLATSFNKNGARDDKKVKLKDVSPPLQVQHVKVPVKGMEDARMLKSFPLATPKLHWKSRLEAMMLPRSEWKLSLLTAEQIPLQTKKVAATPGTLTVPEAREFMQAD